MQVWITKRTFQCAPGTSPTYRLETDCRGTIGHAENVLVLCFVCLFVCCLPFGKRKRKLTLGNIRQSRDGAAAAAGAVELPWATQADSQNPAVGKGVNL